MSHILPTLLFFTVLYVSLSEQLSAQAVYRGRTYNSRVCSNPNCQMCAYIESQLNAQRAATSIINWEQPVKTVSPQKVEKEAPAPEIDVLHVDHFAPTPYRDVDYIASIISPTEDDIFYDIGCGDARVLTTICHAFSCRGVGVELNPKTYEVAREKIHDYDLDGSVRVYKGDALNYTYPEATIVFMYLYPELMEKLLPKLPSGCTVYSYSHKIPGIKKQTEHKLSTNAILYEWTKP